MPNKMATEDIYRNEGGPDDQIAARNINEWQCNRVIYRMQILFALCNQAISPCASAIAHATPAFCSVYQQKYTKDAIDIM